MSRTDEITTVEQRLTHLIDRGYRFIHPRSDDGAVVAVVGIRVHDAVVDIVRLDAEDDATAFRVPEDEPNVLAPTTLLWRSRGGAGEVLDKLLALPDSDDVRL